jgi:PAS domain S-box-containing protein
MKLSTKLFVSFFVVILLVGGIGITSSYINESVKDQVTRESKEAIKEIELAGEMGLQLYRSLNQTQYLLEDQYRQSLSTNFSESGMSNELVIENIDQSLKKFRRSIENIRSLVKKDTSLVTADTTSVILSLTKLEKKFGIYTSLIKQLQQLSSESYADGKEFFTVTIEPYFRTNLLPLIEQVRDEIQADHEQKVATLNNQLDRVGDILGIATILALLIAISITFFLYRSIANPINKLAEAAQNIAQGNLDDRIDYESNDELGQLSQTFNNMAESLSRTTVSRDYVDSIIESMADLLIVTDDQYKITRINSAGLLMLNREEGEILGKRVQAIFKSGLDLIVDGDDKQKEVKIQDAELLVRDQDEIPVNVSKGILQDREGNIEGYVIVASDISSEKEAQQKIKESLREKEVLLAEIHHRVKNNLAVISGLLQMQIWDAENEYAASALRQSQFRVRSIALVHEKLYQSENLSYIEFDRYIRDLLQAVGSTYIGDESNIEIKTELESIVLNINQAIPCSLLLNELVVNAFKHAFEDQDKGRITVFMGTSGQKVIMRVRDNGKGFPRKKINNESLEMSLIETLTKQLGGTLDIQNDEGADIKVTFKAEEVLSDQNFDFHK